MRRLIGAAVVAVLVVGPLIYFYPDCGGMRGYVWPSCWF